MSAKRTTVPTFDLCLELDALLRRHDATFRALLQRPRVDADVAILRDTLARQLVRVPREQRELVLMAAAVGWFSAIGECVSEARKTVTAPSSAVH